MKRKKIAIYVDYCLRIPSFEKTYNLFKKKLFDDNKFSFEIEDSENIRDFWGNAMKNPEIESFYLNQNDFTDDLNNMEWEKYFYNDEHYKRFIEEYSFHLFIDCEVPSKGDCELLNIAQKYLFDVHLFDEVINPRKITNTFFFLSKIRVKPKAVFFISPNEKINESDYLGIWNPKNNKEQSNGSDKKLFEEWLKDLEKQIKESPDERADS